jgi:hypothetical protein
MFRLAIEQSDVNFKVGQSIRDLGNRVTHLTRLVRLKKRAMENIEHKVRGWGGEQGGTSLSAVQKVYLENKEELQAYRDNVERPNAATLKHLKSLSERQTLARRGSLGIRQPMKSSGMKVQMRVPPHPPTMLRILEECTTENR